jgi:23S rRNA (guanosine2251-2'-O)-methyltransferase
MSRRKPFHKKHPGKSGHGAPNVNLGGSFWIYGHHPVTAALGNPKRRIKRILATNQVATELPAGTLPPSPALERIEGLDLGALLPPGAVHQGIAALVDPLPMIDLGELLDQIPADSSAHLVVLDQVTDPQNVGAILRSASAFGAAGLILTERHAAPESGVLAKAASGRPASGAWVWPPREK